MKLYYKSGACSLASHIVLRETGQAFELESVDTDSQKTASGEDFSQINAKGYVPALRLANNQVLTEGAAILQFIADQHPQSGLTPKPGSIERARLQEHLNFTASELHKAFGPFFSANASDADKNMAKENVQKKMMHFESALADGRQYLLGDDFSVCDAYFFVVSSWAHPTGIGLDQWPHISDFYARVAAREKVREAMQAEGLLN